MRAIAVLLALSASVGATASEISDEFKSGFAGVTWGMDLAELMTKFPGGFESFSTSPGGLCYVLSVDDPVLGIARSGQFVNFGIAKDGKVEAFAVQIPYEQTTTLISIITSQLGVPKSLEIQGVSTVRKWPVDSGLVVGIETTNDKKYSLTELVVWKVPTASPSTARGKNIR